MNVTHDEQLVFTHSECPYYPCHSIAEGVKFNCIFCYCPLYALGPNCGGDFCYLDDGTKDCSKCTIMHEGAKGFERVREKYPELEDLAKA